MAAATNASYYYILSSVRSDWPYAPTPGGIATDGYNGHVFWDSEVRGEKRAPEMYVAGESCSPSLFGCFSLDFV